MDYNDYNYNNNNYNNYDNYYVLKKLWTNEISI